jgi:hypothetical protein
MPSRRRFDPRGWSVGLWVVILVAAAVVGSVTVSAATRDTDCFPGRLRAAPGVAAPGDTVRITASAFPCDRRYHRGALYGLRFRSGSSAEVTDLGSFPVATDGSFEAEVTVPEVATPGTGAFIVTGYDIRDVFADLCDDGSSGCAPYTAGIRVT